MKYFSRYSRALTATLAILFGCTLGCGGGSGKAPGAGAAGAAASAKPMKKETIAAHPAKISRSVFTIDQNSRDPFNPQNKKTTAAVANAAPQPLPDVATLLNEGFQGIGGSGDDRIAMINNVLLEQGKSAAIPVKAGAQTRMVQVRCREIARNRVVLEVEGYGQVVVKHKETLRAAL